MLAEEVLASAPSVTALIDGDGDTFPRLWRASAAMIWRLPEQLPSTPQRAHQLVRGGQQPCIDLSATERFAPSRFGSRSSPPFDGNVPPGLRALRYAHRSRRHHLRSSRTQYFF